jgi:hypothetical protein
MPAFCSCMVFSLALLCSLYPWQYSACRYKNREAGKILQGKSQDDLDAILVSSIQKSCYTNVGFQLLSIIHGDEARMLNIFAILPRAIEVMPRKFHL